MQCAVTKFVQQNANGLMLVDMPTGGGKTYQTKEIISKYIRGEIFSNVPRIIYITPLCKNVDDLYSDLQKEFKDNLELLDSYVLRLYPNYDCVLNNLGEVEESIPYEIRNKDSYKNLKKQITLYNNFYECNQSDLADATLKEIQRIYEPAFRKDVTRVLIKKYPIPKDRRRAINNDYSWLPKVYPSCLTEDRKVLIMTMSKFLVANDPIIGKPYRFISHSKTKGALIFVDEFDSTKEVVLQQEIDRCVDHKLDLIKLFSGISNTLKGRVLPESIFAGSTDETAEKGSAVVFASMKKYFLDSEKEFNLNYLFKLDEGINLQQRCFLFDDHKLHTIHASDKEGHIVLEKNKAKNINLIKIAPHDSDGLFYRSIYRMKSAINKFISCCAIMARNYRNYYNERNQDKMEIDHAVSTILDPFNLDGISNQTLQELIINDMSIPSDKRGVDIIQTDFYLDGFRYYDFEDDISHDLSTTTSMCYFENTPEKFMLSLSSIARVVGLSATGTIQTVTGNYNLEYLQVMLADRYHVLSDDDKNRIAEEISGRIGGEYPISVTKQQVIEESSLEKIIKQLVSSKKSVEALVGLLQKFEKPDDNEDNRLYHIKRFVKSMLSVKQFMRNSKSRALLVMTNRNLRVGTSSDVFCDENVKTVVRYLAEELQIAAPEIHNLQGINFQQQKLKYQEDLGLGKRVVVFTSYGTSGSGQNLQYEYQGKLVDIDSIYVELPTNALVHYNGLGDERNLIKYIYQLESLKRDGQITMAQATGNIKSAFKRHLNPHSNSIFDKVPYYTESINNHHLKTLIQAVGRICRTRGKAEEVNIYVDDDIFKQIDFSYIRKHNILVNREFYEIIALNEQNKYSSKEIPINLNRALDQNERLRIKIGNLLSFNKSQWSEESIQQWKNLRAFVLKYPTISIEEINTQKISYRDLYLLAKTGEKINSYWCKKGDRDGEYDKIEYDYSIHDKSCLKISEEESRLNLLMKIPGLKKHFEGKGYATSFKRNDAIIVPIIFQNIYKGALGEEVAEFLLKCYGLNLSEISEGEIFEKFDYRLENFPGIYVDVKNWSEYNQVDLDGAVQKCEEKLKKIGGKKAIIINVAAKNFQINAYGNIITISTLCSLKGETGCYPLGRNEQQKIINKLLEVRNDCNN